MCPIIESLLDLDFYKFNMGQVAWRQYPEVEVAYALTNRTKGVNLAEIIPEKSLREELDHVRSLSFTSAEIDYLASQRCGQRPLFNPTYLQFLPKVRLPGYELKYQAKGIELGTKGRWPKAIYWETMMLSILTELYHRQIGGDGATLLAEGRNRLESKINLLAKQPDITFSDFGTRRRYSRQWQEEVVLTLKDHLPGQFRGTSNVALAMKYGLEPIGTCAHEMDMVVAALGHESDEAIRKAHNQVLQDWWDEYGWELSIALTDTFGTDFFFRDMTAEQARNWKGLRQDSGDPFAFGERAIAFYESHSINPLTKLIVFSDGLDVWTIMALANSFAGRIKVTFGWGTNLTCDLGPKALSLVIKAILANGYPTVKLSDNLAKALGLLAEVERYMRIFGYTRTWRQECTY